MYLCVSLIYYEYRFGRQNGYDAAESVAPFFVGVHCSSQQNRGYVYVYPICLHVHANRFNWPKYFFACFCSPLVRLTVGVKYVIIFLSSIFCVYVLFAVLKADKYIILLNKIIYYII